MVYDSEYYQTMGGVTLHFPGLARPPTHHLKTFTIIYLAEEVRYLLRGQSLYQIDLTAALIIIIQINFNTIFQEVFISWSDISDRTFPPPLHTHNHILQYYHPIHS